MNFKKINESYFYDKEIGTIKKSKAKSEKGFIDECLKCRYSYYYWNLDRLDSGSTFLSNGVDFPIHYDEQEHIFKLRTGVEVLCENEAENIIFQKWKEKDLIPEFKIGEVLSGSMYDRMTITNVLYEDGVKLIELSDEYRTYNEKLTNTKKMLFRKVGFKDNQALIDLIERKISILLKKKNLD